MIAVLINRRTNQRLAIPYKSIVSIAEDQQGFVTVVWTDDCGEEQTEVKEPFDYLVDNWRCALQQD